MKEVQHYSISGTDHLPCETSHYIIHRLGGGGEFRERGKDHMVFTGNGKGGQSSPTEY